MARKFHARNKSSLVHQAVEKSGGIKQLADQLGLTPQTVTQWVKCDRISNKHILKVSHIADVPPLELITYIEKRKKPWFFRAPARKENALDVLVSLQSGEITEGAAFLATKITPRVLRQTLTLWGDRLPLLRDTLHSDLPVAIQSARLGVSERQVRRLIKAYLPNREKVVKPYKIARERAKNKWQTYRSQAVRIVRGEMTIAAAAAEVSLSDRQMHRWLASVLHDRFGITLQTLRPLPRAFRNALAVEIEQEHPEVAGHLIQYWLGHQMKQVPMPPTPESWFRITFRRCLIGLLTGEISLQDLCKQRETEKSRLIPLLTSNLVPLGISFEQAVSWSVAHQESVAEILNALPTSKE